MDIPELKAFVSIAREGSFSKAATLLKMSQPAISRRIQSLESSLQQKLFHRDGQSITLTPVGHRLLPKATEILEIVHATIHEIEGLSTLVQGQMKLAVSHHYAEYYLGTLISKFTSMYPNVLLTFQFAESEETCALVESGRADIGFGTLPLKAQEKLSCATLLTEPLVIAVSKNHELAQYKEGCSSGLLSQSQAILPPMSGFTGTKIQEAFDQRNVNPSKRIECNAFASLKSLLQAQLGWGVLPGPVLDRTVTELQCIPALHIEREIGVIHHRHRTLSPATKALLSLAIPRER